jgi:hypothetical protein
MLEFDHEQRAQRRKAILDEKSEVIRTVLLSRVGALDEPSIFTTRRRASR